MAAGDYDRAAAAAQQAVAKSPNNPEYLELLSDSRTAAADFHFDQADKLMAARRPGAAKVALDRALVYMPAHPGAIKLKMKVEDAIAGCEELIHKALQAAERDDWERAVELASEACRLDESNKPAADLFAQARSGVVSGHLAQARVSLDAGDTRMCLAECAKAARWDKANAFMLKLKRQAEAAEAAAAVVASKQATGAMTPVATARQAEEKTPVMVNSPTVDKKPAAQKVQAEEKALTAAKSQERRIAPTTSAGRNDALIAVEGGSMTASSPPPVAVANSPALISMEKPASQPAFSEGRFWTSEVRGTSKDGRGARTIEIATQQPRTGRWEQRVAAERVESRRSREAGSSAAAGRIADSRQAVSSVNGSESGKPALSRLAARSDRHLLVGIISRDDRRFNKAMAIMDGLTVKLRDTDEEPLDADLEIVGGKFKISPKDVPAGGAVKIRGVSKREYKLTIMWIDHDKDTIKFAVDRGE
jgi:tetratricopeptide (TPR) repeat protein